MSPAQKKLEQLLTLSDVSRMAGISMPTLQKYKKEYASRIPSVGEGRKQRYPVSSLAVFSLLKQEGLARRRERAGRPRKSAVPARIGDRREPKADTLSLQQVGRITGISYPTLLRYVKLHLHRLPSVGEGRTRRYKPEAVEVFRRLREQSSRGRRPSAVGAASPKAPKQARAVTSQESVALASHLRRLEQVFTSLDRRLAELSEALRRPVNLTIRR